MLTRMVRIQLVIFSIASVIGIGVMLGVYMQAPTLLGIGRIAVTIELTDTGGLYRFANVTYRGVEVGKVTDVVGTRDGAVATMSLDASAAVPAATHAAVRSVSAIGEQYVDLQPVDDAGPYLVDGSVIPRDRTSIPEAVGPMLDRVSALIDSIPSNKIPGLLTESYNAFNGADYEIGSLLDSSADLLADARDTAVQTRSLIDGSRELLDGQAASADSLRTWTRALAGIAEQVATNTDGIAGILQTGPSAMNEVSVLLNQVKPTLPVLLANLTTIGQVGVTYHPSLEQLLVVLPPYIAANQSYGLSTNNATGHSLGDFTMTLNDPPSCTVGFLPASSWRSPADLSDIDTPEGLYCKLPQDSPIAVRGARNYPCMSNPGKRAPTVEMCNSELPFEPLAMRQHALGPGPIDPSLVAQGVPLDDRVTTDGHIFGPVGGTPPAPPVVPAPVVIPDSAAPAAFGGGEPTGASVATAIYDPATGQYAAPGGEIFRQTDLVEPGADRTWQQMFPS